MTSNDESTACDDDLAIRDDNNTAEWTRFAAEQFVARYDIDEVPYEE